MWLHIHVVAFLLTALLCLNFAGRIVHERMGSGVWFLKDGTRQAEFIANGEDVVSIDRNADGPLKSIETLEKWMPKESR